MSHGNGLGIGMEMLDSFYICMHCLGWNKWFFTRRDMLGQQVRRFMRLLQCINVS